MQKIQHPKSYLLKMLCLFSASFCLLLLLIFLGVNSIVLNASMRNNEDYQKKLLYQMGVYLNTMHDNAQVACRRIYVSEDAARLMNQETIVTGKEYYENILAMSRLSDILGLWINPFCPSSFTTGI